MDSPFPDPDRALEVSPQNNIKLQLRGEDIPVKGALCRALQVVIKYSDDAHEGTSWRADAYRDIFDQLFDTNHIGTGSAEEKQMHEALTYIAAFLGVRNRDGS